MLTIFRGLPGSGKSTAARKLSAETGALFIEPDMFVIRDGKYQYTPIRYKYATEQVKNLLLGMSYCDWTDKGFFSPDIIYADVLPTAEDVNTIISVCGQTDLHLITLEITLEESIQRNLHDVQFEDLKKMHSSFEKIKIENGRAVKI